MITMDTDMLTTLKDSIRRNRNIVNANSATFSVHTSHTIWGRRHSCANKITIIVNSCRKMICDATLAHMR